MRRETADVLRVAGEHDVLTAHGAERDVPVDDVGRAGAGEEKPDAAGFFVVERDDIDIRKPEEGCEARLSTRVAPSLSDAGRRDGDRVIRASGFGDEHNDVAAVALQCDERTGVEDDHLCS